MRSLLAFDSSASGVISVAPDGTLALHSDSYQAVHVQASAACNSSSSGNSSSSSGSGNAADDAAGPGTLALGSAPPPGGPAGVAAQVVVYPNLQPLARLTPPLRAPIHVVPCASTHAPLNPGGLAE